jgi:hypothetical protein
MNRHRIQALLGVLAASLLPQAASAAPDEAAVVDAVRLPAWVERQGVQQALRPGLVLQNRDRLVTGPEARARIRLGDGSMVALAADTQLDLNALGVRDNDVFTAALDVQRGALRFSTADSPRNYQQRAVNLRVGTITAGIRGTDVWGKADAEADRICLLHGSIAVLHPSEAARQVDEALSCYVAPKGEAALPIAAVSAGQLAWWAAQTEAPSVVQAATASTRASIGTFGTRHGRWAVELATLESEAAALSLYDRARAAGYPVRIVPRAAAGRGYDYAVRVNQLPTHSQAAELAAQMAQSLQLASPLVLRH